MKSALCALGLICLTAHTAFGQAPKTHDPLALIPPKAVVVVQMNGVERVQERLHALLKKAVPDKADEASKVVRTAIGDALSGRDLKALRPHGRVLVAFSDLDKLPDDITVAFLFPATSADDFRKKFLTDEERKTLKKEEDLESLQWEDRPGLYYLVDLPGFVAVCSDKETARLYSKGEIGGVAKQLSAESAKRFLDSDVSVLVNVKEVKGKYGEQLKKYKSIADVFLKGDTIQGVSKSSIEQIRSMLEAAFQVLQDGAFAVLTIEFADEGLRVKALAQFGEKSGTAALLAKSKPSALAQIGTLPSGQVTYFAADLGSIGSKSAASLLGTFSASDDEPAAKESVDRLLRELATMDRGVTFGSSQMTAAGGLELIESRDAERIVAARLAVLKALTKSGSFANVPLKEKPEVSEKAERVGRFDVYGARLKFDLDRAVVGLPDDVKASTKASMKRSVGEEMRLWIGSDGKAVVQVVAKDLAEAKAIVDAQTLGTLEAFQSTRKQLPAEANMLIILDAARTVYSLFGVAKDTAGGAPDLLPFAVPELKAPAGKPVFIGLALVLKDLHGRIEIFVPTAAVEQIRVLLQPLLDRRD